MDPSFPANDAGADSQASRRRSPARTLGLAALLICVALVGIGSVLLSSRASNPAAGHTQKLPSIAIYKPAPAAPATPSGPVSPPGPCHCTSGSFVIPSAPTNVPSSGQYVVVSETHEWLWAYQDGRVVFNTPVTTGRPELATPTGLFHVMERDYGITMTSPWPPSSPYYYFPTYIDYAMLFEDGGYFLHDAWWRSDFGPGSNVPHYTADGTYEDGSHGCVQMPKSAAYWLISWVHVGTPVRVDP